MPDQVIDNTVADAPVEQQNPVPLPTTDSQHHPSPADVPPRRQQPPAAPPQPAADDGNSQEPKSPEDYQKMIADLRKENANWRKKYREAEPIVQQHQELEEAAKTELQRATERAEAAERRDREREEAFARLDIAVQHGIDPDNIDFIGSGSREEMEARAVRVKALQQAQAATAPPSNRPVEGLRPGASPEPPQPADNSYPESWKPNHVRDRERSQHGQ
jgi:hypothetical protein